jgi:two-component system phosphate regulon sensor histidine kinase PhoR
MRITFHNKIFIWLTIPFLIATLLLILIIRSYSISHLKEMLFKEMLQQALLIKKLYLKTDIEAINGALADINKDTNSRYRLTIISHSGKVIYDSEKDSSSMENHSDRPEIVTAFNGGTGFSERFSHTLNTEMAYLAIPIHQQDTITEVIRISIPLHDINEKIQQITKPILIYATIIIMLTHIMLYLITLKSVKPVDDVIDVARRINKGDLSSRLLVPPNKDYEILYNTFNDMLERLQHLISEQKRQKDELYSIISSLSEGLIIVDRDFKIILANNSFTKLLGINNNEITGKFIYEVIKSPELLTLIKNTFEKMYSNTVEIDHNSTSLYINSSYNKTNDAVVLLLYDISRIKNLEIYKRDLILNISHELKTPLTAIIGFADTLYEDTEDETKRRYISIIKDHASRLMSIINDLTTLSSLERGMHLELSDSVNINELIEEVLPIYVSECNKKNLALNTEFGELPDITCDRVRIQQAIINLIDNAIRYTDRGEIRIITGESDDYVRITVEDTGIGIPESSLNRIFERFYVVDKSRSRKTGGTGLGLSIVKHIVERHNGQILVESKPGQGSRFTILLPKKLTQSLKTT